VRFATLGSGSRGNATLVEYGSTRILIDNGFSLRELERRLDLVGLEPHGIEAVLLTHEHGDHAKGVAAFAARYGAAVWTTPGTWKAVGAPEVPRLRLFSGHAGGISIGDLRVLPYTVPHDAREPTQFVFECAGGRLGVLTDAGSVTPHMRAMLRDCDALILECNHDVNLLRSGPYPPVLQRRVGGPQGHLSNTQAAALLDSLPVAGVRHLLLAHVSQKNNRPDLVRDAVRGVCDSLAQRAWLADQEGPGPWIGM